MTTKDEIRQRAFTAMLANALLRWESLVTITLTAILFLFVQDPFPWWQNWFWLVGGGIAEAALVLSTMSDPSAVEDLLSSQFESQYDLGDIRNSVARERLKDAFEYRRNMLTLVKRHKGAMRTSLQQTVSDINDWIAYMFDLAHHIDSFESNDLAERDRKALPQKIEKTKIRIEREQSPEVRRDLENQLRQLEQQQTNLEGMVNSIKRAEIQLESTLSSLGTVYAQMSLLGTKEVDSSRAQRLRLEIQDEVAGLQDTIEAMDEVQAQHLELRR